VHELAHAVVAIRHGVPVGGITLHVFGGVSQLESEPETPRAELLIAIVGPLTSFAVAAVCLGIGRVLTGPPWADVLAGYLAAVNVVVGTFNLIPAFPLDGGRVLRAALWAWSGSADWATRRASRVGSALAVLMVAVGVVRAVTGEVMGGIWLALIGVFLYQAARTSYELVRIRSRLDAVQVAQVMHTAPAVLEAPPSTSTEDVVSPRDSAWQAFLKMTRTGRGRVSVVEDGALVGIVTHRDLQHVIARDDVGAGMARRAG
jgi:Zn-dependent protease